MKKLLARLEKIYPDKYIKVIKEVTSMGTYYQVYQEDLGWIGVAGYFKSLKELEVVLKTEGWLNG